jgi:hypothetical protein
MNVSDIAAPFLDALRHGAFFNIHVEGIHQQFQRGRVYFLHHLHALCDGADEGRRETVDRFDEEECPFLFRCLCTRAKTIPRLLESFSIPFFTVPLDGTDDEVAPQLSGQSGTLLNRLDGSRPNAFVFGRKEEAVFQEISARSECRNGQSVPLCDLSDPLSGNGGGIHDRNFRPVKTQLGEKSRIRFKIAPEPQRLNVRLHGYYDGTFHNLILSSL